MLEARIDLVGKLVTRAAHSGTGGIAALDHEIGDHSMKGDAVVIFLRSEIEEVRDSHRNFACEERAFDVAFAGVENNADVFQWSGRFFGADGDLRRGERQCASDTAKESE